MQPAAVDMARVALLVLLACLACTIPAALAQYDYLGSGSGSGSGSGYYIKDSTRVDQEPDEDAYDEEEDEYIVKYVEDNGFNLCDRYPYGKDALKCAAACTLKYHIQCVYKMGKRDYIYTRQNYACYTPVP